VTVSNRRHFFRDESGATAIEYGLMASLVGVAMIVSLRLVGVEINNVFGAISAAIAR
jgi:pilus assembly protein Flp/PilA